MTALICGSMAYDTVMVFAGRFREQILPDRIHMLNVSFLVPTLKRNFGGCAGNIAYNVKLLGGNGLPMATVGNDFGPYSRWLESCGIERSRLTAEGFGQTRRFSYNPQDNRRVNVIIEYPR